MAGRSGALGTVKIGTESQEVLRWTLDQECEISKYGQGGYKKAVAGVIDIKGSFESVGTPPTVGSTVTLTLEEGSGGATYSGSAVIKKVSVTVNPDTGELIKYAVDFEGDGQWTKS